MSNRILFFLLVLIFKLNGQSTDKLDSKESIVEFSHQFRTIDDRNYKFIDTNFSNLSIYNQWNNSEKDLFHYSVLGSMGNPINNLDHNLFGKSIWTYYDFKSYNQYFIQDSEIKFFKTRSALTEANYRMGYDVGQLFKIYNTQNLNKHLNYLVSYKRLNDLGFYKNNRVKQSNFLFNINYETKKHLLLFYIISEKLEAQENGGLKNDSLFENNVEINRTLLDVNLDDDIREMKNREFFINNEFKNIQNLFKKRPDSTLDTHKPFDLNLGHSLKYSRRTDLYSGVSNTGFYSNYFNQTDTYQDSTYNYNYSNLVYIRTNWGRMLDDNNFKVGIRNTNIEYITDNASIHSNNWGMESELNMSKGSLLFHGKADYIFNGALKGAINLEMKGNWTFLKDLSIDLDYVLLKRRPNLYYHLNYSDNYIWDLNLNDERIDQLNLKLNWKKSASISFQIKNIDQFMYLNRLSDPTQLASAINIASLQGVYNFKFWNNFVHVDNMLLYQNVAQGAEFLPLPEFVSRTSIYFEFGLANNALKCLLGTQMKYFTAYNSLGYVPSLGLFSLERQDRIGNYPLIDLFAQLKIKSATVYLKFEHVNQGVSGFTYFAAPRYPFPDRIFRLGVSWRFFN